MSDESVATKKQKLNDGSAVVSQTGPVEDRDQAIEEKSTNSDVKGFDSLPAETQRLILSNVDIMSVSRIALTNKHWQSKKNLVVEADLRQLAMKVEDDMVEGLFQLFPLLQKINFRSCSKLTADSLSALSTLPNLTSLNLSEMGLKGNAFETIPNCTKLQELILVRCPTTPALLKAICGQLTNLRKLNLFWPPLTQSISDGSLQLMNGLTNLTYLNLSWSEEITDKGVMALGALTNLEVLKLSSSKITDKSLEFIGKTFKNLKKLHIQETLVTNEGIRDYLVPNMPQLTAIALGGKNVTDPALGHIVALKNLTAVITGGSAVTDAGVLSIAKIATLQYVSIWQASITDESLRYLASLMHLKKLKLDGNIYITDDGIERIGGLRKLRLLSLFGCSLVTDRGPRYIANDNLKIIR